MTTSCYLRYEGVYGVCGEGGVVWEILEGGYQLRLVLFVSAGLGERDQAIFAVVDAVGVALDETGPEVGGGAPLFEVVGYVGGVDLEWLVRRKQFVGLGDGGVIAFDGGCAVPVFLLLGELVEAGKEALVMLTRWLMVGG